MENTPDSQSTPIEHTTISQKVIASLRQPLIQYLLLYLTVLCVFLPTFWYTYIWDDWSAIGKNESLREWKRIPDYFTDPNTFSNDPGDRRINAWRPLRNIYYLVTYKIHGLHPAGWHFHQVLLQSLMSVILLAFFRRLYRYAKAWPVDQYLPVNVQLATWFAVLAWSIHPANTEVTAWLKSADDILACLFGIGALVVLFPKNHQLTYQRAIWGAILYGIALLAKESIPPIILIYPMLVIILSPGKRFAIRHRPFLLAVLVLFFETLAYVVIRTILLGRIEQGSYLAGSFSLMMATMSIAIVRYLQLTFWPFWPTVQIGDYSGWPIASSWSNPEVVYSTCIILASVIIIFCIARRSRFVTAGVLFTILAFLPVANIIPMMQVMAERFMYFPLIGVALAMAAIFTQLLASPPRYKLLLPFILICALGTTTLHRLPVWKSNIKFHTVTVAALGSNERALYNKAVNLANSGQTTSALGILTVLRKESPRQLEIAMSTTMLMFNMGYKTSGTIMLDEVVRDFPKKIRPLALKADRARFTDDHKTAAEYYGRAVAIEPNAFPRLQYFAGEAYYKIGEMTSATKSLQRALELDNTLTSAGILLTKIRENEITR